MKIIVLLFPVTLFIIFLSIKLLSPDTYRLLIEEDSFIEYMQSLFFFLSSTFSFFVSIKFFKKKLVLHGVLYCILSIGLFFISLEEISWGQRIFNIANPSYFEQHNWQHEISLHNLDIIRLSLLNTIYIVIGAYGTFTWLILRPFMTRLKIKRENVINFIVPEWPISSYFFFVFFIYMLLSFIKLYPGSFLLWQDQEPAELLLSIGFLLFTVNNYIKLRTFQETTDSAQRCIKTSFKIKSLSARQLFITRVPLKLKTIWNRHKTFMIGLTVVIGVVVLLFAIFKNINMNKHAEQSTDVESTRIVPPAPDEASSVSDLLSNALAFCSGERCANPKKSIEYLNEAIRRQPDFTDAFFIRGNVYAQRGMYQKAINDYNEVIRLNPDNARVYGNRGTVYLMMGDKTSGCADTQKACERGNCHALDWSKRKGLCR
jgi:tetratricopeptide (TPR) repeat protein